MNLTSSLCQTLVDAAHGVACGLDLHKEDWLLEAGLSCELSSQKGTSRCRDDLITTSVGVVLVSHDIYDIVSDASLVLLCKGTFLGHPLETGFDGGLDLSEVLSLRGLINNNVGASSLWSKAPNLFRIIRVPIEGVLEYSASLTHILDGFNLVLFNCVCQLLS